MAAKKKKVQQAATKKKKRNNNKNKLQGVELIAQFPPRAATVLEKEGERGYNCKEHSALLSSITKHVRKPRELKKKMEVVVMGSQREEVRK